MEKVNRAVFLDRDGTINEDTGYIDDIRKFTLLSGVPRAVKLLNKARFKVIVVTNQSGVARGFFTEDTVREINTRMQQMLYQKSAIIDAVYFCPHHPEAGRWPYKRICDCRKPKPGLLKKAAREHNIDLFSSYMIGDDVRDIEAGYSAGCRTILLLTKQRISSPGVLKNAPVKPDYVAEDLCEAVRWILLQEHSKEK